MVEEQVAEWKNKLKKIYTKMIWYSTRLKVHKHEINLNSTHEKHGKHGHSLLPRFDDSDDLLSTSCWQQILFDNHIDLDIGLEI